MKPIYTIDLETDPFVHGREPLAFCCGLYDGEKFYHTWGPNCITEMKKILFLKQPGIVYAHNGGKFDCYVRGGERIIEWFALRKPITIINGRIIRAFLNDPYNGKELFEFRDSYAIFPDALAKYKKDDIDYTLFEKDVRDSHKEYILKYLQNDCVYLYELCEGFHERFGGKITVGSAAMSELKKLHKYTKLSLEDDVKFREHKYYYGGRTQCFEKGILHPKSVEKFSIYDINQSYPNAMHNFLHPISEPIFMSDYNINDNTYFVTVSGRNRNALPSRDKNGLNFSKQDGVFSCSIYEYNAAVECDMFDCDEVLGHVDFSDTCYFDKFVDIMHALRNEAKISGDKVGDLFYKRVGNSAYGKFGQNPEKYKEYIIVPSYVDLHCDCILDDHSYCFKRESIIEIGDLCMWSKKAENVGIFNVCTCASITGAARSVLLRAIAKSQRPIYCDTDSLICESLDVKIDDKELGAWKLEGQGNCAAIAGKKLYAIFDGSECIKMATKGVNLGAEEIVRVCMGEKITFKNIAPSYHLGSGLVDFLSRDVTMT